MSTFNRKCSAWAVVLSAVLALGYMAPAKAITLHGGVSVGPPQPVLHGGVSAAVPVPSALTSQPGPFPTANYLPGGLGLSGWPFTAPSARAAYDANYAMQAYAMANAYVDPFWGGIVGTYPGVWLDGMYVPDTPVFGPPRPRTSTVSQAFTIPRTGAWRIGNGIARNITVP